ncbi:MAG TPA: amino acid adenylation domain-containing protein, partial [Nitrolancea sp.]|nr:amino acid adenylation domain-containing protein [Nitrolancea sp.]
MRELARRSGSATNAVPSVVFTSAIGFDDGGAGPDIAPLVDGLTQSSHVLLDHQLYEHDGRLVVNWDGVADLFEPGVFDAMFDAYVSVVRRIAASNITVDEYAWGNSALVELDPASEHVCPRALHAPLFDLEQTRAGSLAVIAADGSLTYAELVGRASRLAGALVRRGVAQGDLVGVRVSRGWRQPVAVLAVLWAGAAYLPLSAEWPTSRCRSLLGRSGTKLILADSGDTEDYGCASVTVDAALAYGEPIAPAPVDPGSTAYVIYTSGSTGEPKGVEVTHGAASNTIDDVNARLQLKAGDRILSVSQLSFDLSVWDLFGAWADGAALVVPSARQDRDPEHWRELVHRHDVTIWNSVPALMSAYERHCVAVGATAQPLRAVMLSGDWIPVDLPKRVRNLVHPDIRVIGLGGATEASIWSVWYDIEAVDPAWRSIPYGTAMKGQGAHVLDDDLGERPDWAVGELYLSGVGLASGYWKDPDRTAERFRQTSRATMYRTGDLARRTGDGTLELIGRIDDQVKINGYRIELGEVEAALRRLSGIEDAVAAVVDDGQSRRLAAWVVLAVDDDNPFRQVDSTDEAQTSATLASAVDAARSASERLPLPAHTFRALRDELEALSLQSMANALLSSGALHPGRDPVTIDDLLAGGRIAR